MKKLLLPFILVAITANAQKKETVDLKWKITDTLTYKTVMQDVILEKNKEQTESDSISEKISGMFKTMQEQLSDLKYETKLFPDKNGNVDIEMMLKKDKTDTTETIFSGMAKMNGNIVLRGKVSPEGELLSFYYKSAQNNLISILFELPTKQVAIGDEWDLKIDMISMDQNFKADSLYKKSVVRLKDIKIEKRNKIAVIEYDLEAFVSGDFGNGIMSVFSKEEGDKKIFMKTSHKAIGKFDLDKGYWISYDGIMDIETNFTLMGIGGNKRTEFKLTPEK
ncbi:hypothetical protein [Aestuariibaculum suncheonense]|uniref:Uncharacterized protein n=1 Tax=Aestuariibaculum suncheonense TaxID=1028745 RepID=A0A8J6QG68_9FLAO|nr:hypothetical protein [Aestuariibaculum suncheonense]MBD0836103.1 hypothetical protein [Aestuariibaculum suncheonense]